MGQRAFFVFSFERGLKKVLERVLEVPGRGSGGHIGVRKPTFGLQEGSLLENKFAEEGQRG